MARSWARPGGRIGPHSEVVRSAERERALYDLDLPAPRLLGRGPAVLLLEDVSGASPSWGPADLNAAIAGLARIHATGLSNGDWMPPERSAATLVAQQPLWDALAAHALSGPFGRWLGATGRTRYETLLDSLSEWAAIRDALPQTLIHNDFSPRNATVRDGALLAWDWELAGRGLPQRDLAELLCFVPTDGRGPRAILELAPDRARSAPGEGRGRPRCRRLAGRVRGRPRRAVGDPPVAVRDDRRVPAAAVPRARRARLGRGWTGLRSVGRAVG